MKGSLNPGKTSYFYISKNSDLFLGFVNILALPTFSMVGRIKGALSVLRQFLINESSLK